MHRLRQLVLGKDHHLHRRNGSSGFRIEYRTLRPYWFSSDPIQVPLGAVEIAANITTRAYLLPNGILKLYWPHFTIRIQQLPAVAMPNHHMANQRGKE